MNNMNVEIKARCQNHEDIKKILEVEKANYKGLDNQVDTYFVVNSGRMKLREGNIENALIHYDRDDKEEPKISDFILYKPSSNELLKELLTKALGILTVVKKKREIYYINNVKINLDKVEELGSFIEIEVMAQGDDNRDKLLQECKYYLKLFRIKDEELIPFSYSDMILRKMS
jgi:adenylate cyclase, class 2